MSAGHWFALIAFFLAVGAFACWLARRNERARNLIIQDLLNHSHVDIGAVRVRTQLSIKAFDGAILDLREMGLIAKVEKGVDCTKDGCGCLSLEQYELTKWGRGLAEYLQHAGEVGA